MPAVTVGSVLLFLNIAMELLGSEELQKLLGGLPGLKGQRMKDAWEEMAEYVSDKARDQIVAKDLDWTGKLLAGIDHEVIIDGDEISAIIFSDELYAPFQERGTVPYWPNIDALEPWAADHGLTGYIVARAISVTGLEAQEFFQEALEDSEQEILRRVGRVLAEVQ